jgi:TorA maturation chaperone TorD
VAGPRQADNEQVDCDDRVDRDARDGRVAPAARLADICARRAAVYQALVLGFREPSEPYLAALAGGELVEGLREAVAWLGPDAVTYEPALTALEHARGQAAKLGVAAALRDLAVEHARLFTGPGHPAVMCYASQYLDGDGRASGRLNGAGAAAAPAAQQRPGVTTAPQPRELPDYMATELEFLFHLCRREEDAWVRGDGDVALGLRRALDRFLGEHASRWLPEFAAAVSAATAVELYPALADLLVAHLSAEFGVRRAGDGAPSA